MEDLRNLRDLTITYVDILSLSSHIFINNFLLDWNELFTTKCVSCGFPIEAGDRWVEALNNNYHSQCFNCMVCRINWLTNQVVYELLIIILFRCNHFVESDVYCIFCFSSAKRIWKDKVFSLRRENLSAKVTRKRDFESR